MEDLDKLYATHSGKVKIGELEVPCAVLNNGKRVFIQREIVGLLTGNKKGGFDRYLNAKNLEPYLPEKFKSKSSVQSTYSFKLESREAQGFEATDLIDICMMYINAKNDNKLIHNQIPLAVQSIVIISAFAKTGVIAVIDEATGFLKEKNRAKNEFQKFLLQFMREDAAKLVKRFDDSFFEMIYKMRGWTWNYAHKYPGVVGIWINDIVYERIAPLVLIELQKKNPIVEEKGHRKYKHHQYLSEDIGVPKLLNHLSAVEALGRASGYNWSKFMIMLDTAFPKQYQQLSFLFDDYEDELHKLSSFDKTMKKALDYDPSKDKE